MLHEECLPIRFAGERCFSTAILFLLSGEDFSAFHRLKSDELWHFHSGSPLNIYVISPEGAFSLITLGTRFDQGQEFQSVVRAGSWFASAPTDAEGYSFVGCTVSPGFDFEDFEMATAKELSETYPQHRELIERFCR
jgi:predicted cupin superfamily sugar epimerase